MKPAAKFALFIALLILLKPFTTTADEIILKGGGIVQGTIVEQNDENIVVTDVDGVSSTVHINDVERTVRSETKGDPETQGNAGINTNEKVELVLQNGHSGGVNSVVFSPEGKTSPEREIIASGSSDGAVKLWFVDTGELLRSLEGHSAGVHAIAFSPDGIWLASGSDDNTVKLWSVETGELIHSFEGHSDGVWSIAFSPDGKLLASGSWDYTVKMWSVKTGEIVHSLEGYSCDTSIAFSPDGKWLSGGFDSTVRLWYVETGTLVYSLEGHSDRVNSIAFSPDGKLLASGSDDNTVKLWSVETGEFIQSLDGHSDWVKSIAFSPNGKLLASGCLDSTVKLWSVETGEIVHSLEGHSVGVSPDGKWLASGSGVNTIMLWSVETGELLHSLEGHSDIISAFAFSPDGKWLASGSLDSTVKLWSVETGEIVHSLDGHSEWFESIALSPDGKWLASRSWDYTVTLWSVETGEIVHSLDGHSYYVTSIALSPDGKWLASGSGDDNTVKLWSVETGEIVHSLEGYSVFVAFSSDRKWLASGSWGSTVTLWSVETGEMVYSLEEHSDDTSIALSLSGRVSSIAFSPDGKWLASGYLDSTVNLWSVETGEIVYSLDGHSGAVRTIAFSPDGKWLASRGSDSTVIWSVETGVLVHSLEGHSDNFWSIAFSPDGKWLSESDDDTIKLWSMETGELVHSLEGHSAGVWDIAFSPDGKWLASGSTDNTVKLWSVETGEQMYSLEGHTGNVESIAFSPDGRFLASGSWDTSIKLWNPSTGQLLATLTAFDDGNWFVLDSAGRFDCSGCERGDPNSGKKYIRWRGEDNTLYAPDQFFRKFYEPGLLADVVKMGFVAPVEGVGSMDEALRTPPPEVAFDSPENMSTVKNDTLEVKVRVSEVKGGGVENVRLFVNGRPVADPPRDATPAGAPAGVRVFAFTAPLAAGENHIMALATSRSGIDSRQAEITVTADIPAHKPDLYLLTVGINKYDKIQSLTSPVKDADDFAALVDERGAGMFAHIHHIPLRDAEADVNNLRDALQQIQEQATFNDVVIIYYSGHGQNTGDGWYLITHEITSLDQSYLIEHAFSDLELKAFLKRVRAGKVVLVMDACYAGAVPKTLTQGISKDKVLIQLAYGSGAYVMAAAGAAQGAYDTAEDLGNSLFTYYLLGGMRGPADADASRSVEVSELNDYTGEGVTGYIAESSGLKRQKPFFWQAVDGPGPTLVAVP